MIPFFPLACNNSLSNNSTVNFSRNIHYNVASLIKGFLYFVYERLLSREIKQGPIPTHLGLILDGNRRYAREMGFDDVAEGHREGARKLDTVLQWCAELDVKIVTIWVLSPENIHRTREEVEALFGVIKEKMEELANNPVIRHYGYRIKTVGNLDALPDEVREAIRRPEESTRGNGERMLNIAIAYGGREEIVEAVKRAIREKDVASMDELASCLTAEDIANHLYTCGIPDPDLIIRTSGEIRLSGFLLWQSAYSEFYFCDALWPAFRKIDFLRAIRSYQHRTRRFGK
jgi:short-chain Z-isoprenyl diphosphate synthase